MAKGFTVKAKEPPKGKVAAQAEEWDYEKAKEMLQRKEHCILSSRSWRKLYLPKELCSNVF